MVADYAPRVKREAPRPDDYIRLAEIGMSEREFIKKHPYVVIYGPADDPYVSLAELEEGDDA